MLGLIGSICNDFNSASGQAVRTTILYNALCKRYGDNNIFCLNTHTLKKNKAKMLAETIRCILKCDHIIIMVHENGRKIYFPILSFAKRILRRHVYHNVIGGSFAEYLKANPSLIKATQSFDVNWVQMGSQIKKLEQLGVTNNELLPNTKEIEIVTSEDLRDYSDVRYRFCTLSRISKAKGIEAAINAIEEVNNRAGKEVATLDIYGNPDADYKERFEELMHHVSSAVSYKGFVDNKKTVETIRGYYMLLFPSTYEGEGFPGTAWDAFAAGVPIIATNWKYNAEVITDKVTGLIYDYQDQDMLVEKIVYAINHQEEINAMRLNCIKDISQYTPEKVFPIIFKYFDPEFLRQGGVHETYIGRLLSVLGWQRVFKMAFG